MGEGWTDEQKEQVRAMHAKGMSAGETANALPGGRTRNAVIGLWHRMGLSGTRVGGKKWAVQKVKIERRGGLRRGPRRTPSSMALTFNPYARPNPKKPEDEVKVAAPPVPVPVTESKPCTLFDLSSHTCRFPLWPDGERAPPVDQALYCGAPPMDGSAYCTGHHKGCRYTPVRQGPIKPRHRPRARPRLMV